MALVGGGGGLARAYFVGIQVSNAARDASLYIAREAPYYPPQPGVPTTTGNYSTMVPSANPYVGCSTAGGSSEGLAVAIGCQSFAGTPTFVNSLVGCPANDMTWTVTPLVLPPQSGNSAQDSFAATVTANCQLQLFLPFVPPSINISSTSTSWVVQP